MVAVVLHVNDILLLNNTVHVTRQITESWKSVSYICLYISLITVWIYWLYFLHVSDGSGRLDGLDISPDMVKNAEHNFADAILSGKLGVTLGDVMRLPYRTSSFDRIYHTNCYYFWPDPSVAAAELLRVLKPNGIMVTALNLSSVKQATESGFITGLTDPQDYCYVLYTVGFINVSFKCISGDIYAVYAYAGGNK